MHKLKLKRIKLELEYLDDVEIQKVIHYAVEELVKRIPQYPEEEYP